MTDADCWSIEIIEQLAKNLLCLGRSKFNEINAATVNLRMNGGMEPQGAEDGECAIVARG